MKNLKHLLLLSILAVSTLVQASDDSAKTIHFMTIGNSFSGNATQYLDEFVEASGKHRLIRGGASRGGHSLARHWGYVEKYEANPEDPAGSPYNGKSLKDVLTSKPWDVVTIQQVSMQSMKIETYRPYARNLFEYIRKHAPQAEVRLHQTWVYRADDTVHIRPDYSQEQFHADVRNNYHTIAGELGIAIIPVGEAFANARRHPDWNFTPDPDFDYENPAYPNLPRERHSLCAGYRWRESKDGTYILRNDTHHANLAGKYLGSAVFYESLFGDSVVDIDFVPEGLSPEDAAFLRGIAHETVREQKAASGGSFPPRQ